MTARASQLLRRGLVLAVMLIMCGFIAFGRLQCDGWAFNEYDAEMHIAAFAVLTALAIIAFPRVALHRLAIGLIVLGGALEVLQATPGLNRTPSWSDFASNIVGIGFALFVVTIVRSKQSDPPKPDDPNI